MITGLGISFVFSPSLVFSSSIQLIRWMFTRAGRTADSEMLDVWCLTSSRASLAFHFPTRFPCGFPNVNRILNAEPERTCVTHTGEFHSKTSYFQRSSVLKFERVNTNTCWTAKTMWTPDHLVHCRVRVSLHFQHDDACPCAHSELCEDVVC